MRQFFTLLALIASVLAVSRQTPPAGSLVVGPREKYKTIQEAVDAAGKASGAQKIFIQPGTYAEQVVVPSSLKGLIIYGSTPDSTSYSGNTVTITAKKSQKDGLSNDGAGTLRVLADNVKVYNVNVVNAYGKGSQAPALSSQGNEDAYYGCSFQGFQDTLLSEGKAYYAKVLVEGATDFIFGQKGVAWFEASDVRVVATNIGFVTANGRESSSNPSYFVIDRSTISAASGNSVTAGSYYLGRPWGDYSRVTVQQTSMTNVIDAAGWHIWNTGDNRTDHVSFTEYGNTGAGASGTRASFATKASSAVSIGSVLGSTSWIDSDYLD